MKTLIYTHEFPPFMGGASTLAWELANGLHELGNNVSVLTKHYGEEDMDIDGAAPFRVFRAHPEAVEVDKHASILSEVLDAGFDRVIVSEFHALRCAMEARKRTWHSQPPYIIVALGSEILRYFVAPKLRPWREDLTRYYLAARHVATISKSTRNLLLKHLPELAGRTSVVYPGINPDTFPELPEPEREAIREELGLTGRRVVGCISRIGFAKGHDFLLPAFKSILRYVPEAMLLLVGDGKRKYQARKLVKQLGLQRYVKFMGAIEKRTDLYKYYNACDVVAMPSRRRGARVEGFGLVFLEAASCGVGVIAGRNGGVTEAVEDGVTGLLVDPREPADIGRGLLEMLNNPARCREMGRRGRERVLRHFTHLRMAREIQELAEEDAA